MMQVTEENLQNTEIQKYIKVNNGYQKCTVDEEKKTIRKSIEGNMLTLYQCKLTEEISDESGFWIHKDCLNRNKIKDETFPKSDERETLNGKEITIEKTKYKDSYKFVTVRGGVNRTEFLRQQSDIYLREGGETELEAEQVLKVAEEAQAEEEARAEDAKAQPPPQAPPQQAPPKPPSQAQSTEGFNVFF